MTTAFDVQKRLEMKLVFLLFLILAITAQKWTQITPAGSIPHGRSVFSFNKGPNEVFYAYAGYWGAGSTPQHSHSLIIRSPWRSVGF